MYITTCQLILQRDFFCETCETRRYLHNYGLTFALGLVAAPYFNNSAMPRYAQAFATLNAQQVYVLPAKPLTTGSRFEFVVLSIERLRVSPWLHLDKAMSILFMLFSRFPSALVTLPQHSEDRRVAHWSTGQALPCPLVDMRMMMKISGLGICLGNQRVVESKQHPSDLQCG